MPFSLKSLKANSWIEPRIYGAMKGVYSEWCMLKNHRKGVRYVEKNCTGVRPLRVHLGCGKQRKTGWLNVDLWPGPWATPDICLDVSRPLPFKTNSLAEIYSEHMFEHLEFPEAVKLFLSECYRILEPQGKLTIGVPDLDHLQNLYQQQMKGNGPVIEMECHNLIAHPLEQLNESFHQHGEHKFLYNEEYLLALLKHFGFADARRRPFDPAMDAECRRAESLYVVATKPGE